MMKNVSTFFIDEQRSSRVGEGVSLEVKEAGFPEHGLRGQGALHEVLIGELGDRHWLILFERRPWRLSQRYLLRNTFFRAQWCGHVTITFIKSLLRHFDHVFQLRQITARVIDLQLRCEHRQPTNWGFFRQRLLLKRLLSQSSQEGRRRQLFHRIEILTRVPHLFSRVFFGRNHCYSLFQFRQFLLPRVIKELRNGVWQSLALKGPGWLLNRKGRGWRFVVMREALIPLAFDMVLVDYAFCWTKDAVRLAFVFEIITCQLSG